MSILDQINAAAEEAINSHPVPTKPAPVVKNGSKTFSVFNAAKAFRYQLLELPGIETVGEPDSGRSIEGPWTVDYTYKE